MARSSLGLGFSLLAGVAGLAASCGGNGALSTSPTTVGTAAVHPSHGLPLIAVTGSGTGIVNVTANARGGFTVNTRDSISVHGTMPDTILYVRAAADVGLPDGQQADGVCQRAVLGQFMPLLAFPGGPPATLATSPGGAGVTAIEFGITNPFMPDGASLDLVIRLVDALPPAVPAIDLRTPCFTLVTK